MTTPSYIAALPHHVRTAAVRIAAMRSGERMADVWPGRDEAVNWSLLCADFQAIADQWRWLHPASEHEESDAVAAWMDQFIDDIRAVESTRHFVRSY